MKSMTLINRTRRLDEDEETPYNSLDICDQLLPDGTPAMCSLWKPSEGELELLKAGRPVRLTILGVAHPPVMVEVEPMQKVN